MNVNEILKQLRQKKNLTQAEAALKLDVSLSSYQKYERDKNSVMPSIDVLLRLADFYNVSLDYLLGREPKADPYLDLNLKKADEDEMLKKYMSLPENVRAMLLKVMKELVGEGEDDDEQLAEELAKTRQTAVSGELLEQWEREQQAPEKGTG